MKYQFSLIAEIEADNEKQAKRKALKHLSIAEIKAGIYSPSAIVEACKDIKGAEQEHFVVFLLNTQNEIIKREMVSMGTLNTSLAHPREIFKAAIRENCASIIIAHNHPSGSLEASNEDIATTNRLQDAGKILGIELLDHVIVTSNGYASFKEKDLI